MTEKYPNGAIVVVRTRQEDKGFGLSAILLESEPRIRRFETHPGWEGYAVADGLHSFMDWAQKLGPGLTFAARDLAPTWCRATDYLGSPLSREGALWADCFPYQLDISSFARAVHRDLYAARTPLEPTTPLGLLVESDAEYLYQLLTGTRHVHSQRWEKPLAMSGELPFNTNPAPDLDFPSAPLPPTPRPLADWSEELGPVLWWRFPVREPPYVGTPLDDDFPDYATHWTPCPTPSLPRDT